METAAAGQGTGKQGPLGSAVQGLPRGGCQRGLYEGPFQGALQGYKNQPPQPNLSNIPAAYNSGMIETKAMKSLGLIKRANNKLTDLPTDAQVLAHNRRNGYNINTNEGG